MLVVLVHSNIISLKIPASLIFQTYIPQGSLSIVSKPLKHFCHNPNLPSPQAASASAGDVKELRLHHISAAKPNFSR